MIYNNRKEFLKTKSLSLPELPGVYIMRNSDKTIIYIGKAKKLKNRVTQYFGEGSNHTDKVRQMVSNVYDFEYIICDSEFEALILECSLIKQKQPKYNILLKDDKGYSYIKITKTDYPVITHAFSIDDDSDYIGPFNSHSVVQNTIDEACKIFKIPQCSKVFNGNFKSNARPCLNYHIGICSAPCCKKISKSEYLENVKQAVEFIKSGASQSISVLTHKMLEASEKLDFEKAAKYRDRISAIERINEKQKVYNSIYKRQDIISIASDERAFCVEVFVFSQGKLSDRKEYIFDNFNDAATLRSEFIMQFYQNSDNDIPPRISVDGEVIDHELIEKMLYEKSGKKVTIAFPKIGEQEHLIAMCKNNAIERLSKYLGRNYKSVAVLEELKNLLNLKAFPKYIESYDISHTSGADNVAGMVVFYEGEPLKKAYKKFKINSFDGQDDYKSMVEVITRRFNEYKNAQSDIGFGRMPDLILLDGGKGQVSVVKSALEEMNIEVPVFGMVKDSKHKTNAISHDGKIISIKSNKFVFNFITKIQDEVHRFAISYHHKSHKKSVLQLELNKISGIGEKKAKSLLINFKTIDNIKKADIEQLSKLPGISKKNAEDIFLYFNNQI